jgi:hypothetical protein
MVHVNYKNGFVIEHKFLFGNEALDPNYINLATHIGEDMRYQKVNAELIDFPGEYDIQ